MNTIVTSKEAILKASKEIAALHGFQSLNMRDVAKHCNVAVGSVYNYFPSKADLVTATVEDIWKDVFHEMRVTDNSDNFTDSVAWLFKTVSSGVKEYPAFFTVHPMGFSNDDKEKGREAMIRNFGHIKNNLLSSLKNDSNVKLGTFNETFTPENFVDFVFSNVLTLLINKEQSCYMLTEVIKRTIY
ncbi:MAG: TetR/AcrR family transcriptional regulator [Sedimentibacter sp.]|uniref:TetR/AcrR family transcriptional regulator n=1 Tax=Sedimentibacter sp. TaxID=1960295 RepID=UPI0031590FDD